MVWGTWKMREPEEQPPAAFSASHPTLSLPVPTSTGIKGLCHHCLASIVHQWLARPSDCQASFICQNINQISYNMVPLFINTLLSALISLFGQPPLYSLRQSQHSSNVKTSSVGWFCYGNAFIAMPTHSRWQTL